ncbi:hypothetical protein C8R46DRAFT_1065714 [Mycena filopes]|nr:hypothetical protein C8R46DRAFT_1065714 [Mycena filopes]
MKTEEIPDDTMDTAKAMLADAFAQAKRALAARDEPLAALQKQCRELQDEVATLKAAAIIQAQALADERALRMVADKRFADMDSQVKEERAALVKEHEQLKVAQKYLEKKNVALKEGQTQLKAAQTKLLADKRATVSHFKRSLAEMEEGLKDEQRPVKPLPKRQKTDAAPSANTVPKERKPAVKEVLEESQSQSEIPKEAQCEIPKETKKKSKKNRVYEHRAPRAATRGRLYEGRADRD